MLLLGETWLLFPPSTLRSSWVCRERALSLKVPLLQSKSPLLETVPTPVGSSEPHLPLALRGGTVSSCGAALSFFWLLPQGPPATSCLCSPVPCPVRLHLAWCLAVQPTHEADHADTQGGVGAVSAESCKVQTSGPGVGAVAAWHIIHERLAG